VIFKRRFAGKLDETRGRQSFVLKRDQDINHKKGEKNE
jgi:hypothetical protein